MAQSEVCTLSTNAGGAQPFPMFPAVGLPPGLEIEGVGPAPEVPPGLDPAHAQLVRETEARLDAHTDKMWQLMQQMLQHVEAQGEKQTALILDEMKQCNERNKRLEEEQVKLKQEIDRLTPLSEAATRLLSLPFPFAPSPGFGGAGSGDSAGAADPLAAGFPRFFPPLPQLPPFPMPPGMPLSASLDNTANGTSAVPDAAAPPLPEPPAGLLLSELTLPPSCAPGNAGPAWAAKSPKQQSSLLSPNWQPSTPIPPVPSAPGTPKARAMSMTDAVGLMTPKTPKATATSGLYTDKTPQGARSVPAEALRQKAAQSPQLFGTPRKQRTPKELGSRASWSLMSSPTPAKSPNPFVIFEDGGSTFSFTLRRADGVELGVETVIKEDGQTLSVKGVAPGGAIEAWNRQCAGGPAAGKAVQVGDVIVSVNDVSDIQEMLKECETKHLLRLTIVRSDTAAAGAGQPMDGSAVPPPKPA